MTIQEYLQRAQGLIVGGCLWTFAKLKFFFFLVTRSKITLAISFVGHICVKRTYNKQSLGLV